MRVSEEGLATSDTLPTEATEVFYKLDLNQSRSHLQPSKIHFSFALSFQVDHKQARSTHNGSNSSVFLSSQPLALTRKSLPRCFSSQCPTQPVIQLTGHLLSTYFVRDIVVKYEEGQSTINPVKGLVCENSGGALGQQRML